MPRRQGETKIQAHPKLGGSPTVRESVCTPITREYIHSLRGKFKGKGLLKALTAEKKKEGS
jgi:hypothetical protein